MVKYVEHVSHGGISSRRMAWTVLYPNTTMYIHYKRHLEAVMCVKGDCEVELVKPMSEEGTGEVFKVLL